MNNVYRTAARSIVALLAAGIAATAWGQGLRTAALSVSATVANNCLIATTPVAFGSYDPVSTNSATGSDVTANGFVTVICTRNATGVTIALGLGNNPSGSIRRLSGGGTNFLAYDLYHPSAATPDAICTFPGVTVWSTLGTGLFTPSGIAGWGALSAKIFNICGTIPKGQDVPAASYTDSVIATINF